MVGRENPVEVQPDESMLEALERTGVDMMYDCRRGECGLCEVRIVSFEGRVDHRDVFHSDRQEAPNTKRFCCVSRVIGSGSGDSRETESAARGEGGLRDDAPRSRVVIEAG